MAKFDGRSTAAPPRKTGPIKAGRLDQRTGNGAPAFSRDAKSDLFLLAVTNFVSEDTFYESGRARDERFEKLVHQVTAEDPEWMQKFIPWLRNEANMRSASIVAAAEYVKAGGPNARLVTASALSRADEPGEFISYWLSRHGRAIPMSVKRGVGMAAQKFYNERNVLKYDSDARSMRFGDVLSLVHPKPKAEWQSTLFRYVLADRFGNEDEKQAALAELPMLAKNREFREMPAAKAREILLANPDQLAAAGFTWESFSSLGKMDAAAWEAMIPTMGYMALLRNLRNFDQNGVSDEVAEMVARKLSDPDEVARSRQLPFRFWSAYREAPSLRWGSALEKALDLSCSNVPAFKGKTLILIDTSGSMQNYAGGKMSNVMRVHVAALFGAILAKRNPEGARVVQFASTTQELPFPKAGSALRFMDTVNRNVGKVGHGTEVARAVNTWNGEDRIVILSDLQTTTRFTRAGGARTLYAAGSNVPATVPVYGFNLAGYAATPLASGNLEANEHEMGGVTDKTFSMISMIEQAKTAGWPWEN